MGKYLIIAVLFLFSCGGKQQDFASDEAFQAYLNDASNGFIQAEETADFLFETKLVPALVEEDESQLTVQLRISLKDGKPVLDYGGVSQQEALTREGYLSFDLVGDVHLESGSKSIPAIFHHYERNYRIKPSVDVYFNFKNFVPQEDVYFVYRDQVFNQGLVKIKFSKELFKSCHVQK